VTKCHKLVGALALAGLLAALVASVAGASEGSSKDVVLVTHDSFAIPKAVKSAFEQQTGYRLRILQGGDAGEMLNRALLTKGNPQGDAIFGVDNNLLSRAVGAGLLERYTAKGLARVPRAYRLDPTHELTPVDHGDVCLNVDKRWFTSHRLAPPVGLGDLTKPAYRKLLVVENPATSTPGLAFMLATIARYGEPGWEGYWKKLRANGVLVVDGWEEAYTARFSGAGGSKGDRPIVVSYATSPPAEVIFAKVRPKTAPTAAVTSTCFRQVELAGVLKGAKNPAGAKALVDFMLGERFQASLPDSMFVLPVRSGTPLPAAFRRYAVSPAKPLELPAAEIGRNRDRWVDEWTSVVLR
jgi:thiamine transport system substrate-binding protein